VEGLERVPLTHGVQARVRNEHDGPQDHADVVGLWIEVQRVLDRLDTMAL
jgi:hypothetical protein